MRLVLEDGGTLLAEQVRTAHTFKSRLQGLLFKPPLPKGTCLHIRPCTAIHTFSMRYAIDVLYLDDRHRIVAAEWNLLPGKRGRRFAGVRSVVEFPAGSIPATIGEIEGRAVRFID